MSKKEPKPCPRCGRDGSYAGIFYFNNEMRGCRSKRCGFVCKRKHWDDLPRVTLADINKLTCWADGGGDLPDAIRDLFLDKGHC